MSRKATYLKAGDKRVTVSNPDKVLFPDSDISKKEYVTYYRDVAQWALPHLRGRPVSLERFPNGVQGDRFYQKEIPEYFPDYVRRVDVESEGETKPYGVIDNAESLVYVANMVAVIHTWMSCADHLARPDRIVWDMDPNEVGFDKVRAAARLMRYLLGELGMNPYVMTTGSRGVHVVVAIEPEFDTDAVFGFSKESSEFITARLPDLFTTEFTKSKRGKRVFLDYLRNRAAQTAVAPYVVRANEGGPVSMPITWEELDDEDLGPQTFTLRNALKRLRKSGDAWENMYATPDQLGPAMEILRKKSSSG